MRLVKQANGYSCGIACLAMVLGKRHATIAKVLGRDCSEDVEGLPWREQKGIGKKLGITGSEMLWILYSFGVPAGQWLLREYHAHWGDAAWDLTCVAKDDDLRAHIRAGGTAIVGVPSKNIPDGFHWLVVSGGKVFDPSKDKTYTSLEEVAESMIQEAILIGKSPKSAYALMRRGTSLVNATATHGG